MKQSEKAKQELEQYKRYSWRVYVLFAAGMSAIAFGILIYKTLNI